MNPITQLRRGLNITQAQLAARIDKHPSFIGHLEQGNFKEVTEDTMKTLAEVLKTNPVKLAWELSKWKCEMKHEES